MPENIKEALADETDKLVHQIFEQGVDGIIGGFPCQDISSAGKGQGIQRNSAGEATTRSGLFWEFVKTYCLVRPKYWIMENVAALLSRGMGDVLGAVAECGIDAEWDSVAAFQFGLPHERERVYIMAYNASDGWPEALRLQLQLREKEAIRQTAVALDTSCNLVARTRGEMDGESPFCRRNDGVAERLHAIGNGNPPCVIRELTKDLK